MTPERRQQLEDQLSAYLDDELSEAERAEVETLLGEDTAARRLLAELEATATGLRGLPRAKASADLMNDLRTRMERQALLGTPGTSEGTREAPVPALARWLAAAAVVAVAFVGGYWLWTFREQPPAPSVSRPLTMVDRSESSRYVRHEQKGIRVLDEVGTAQTAREEKADHEEAAAPEQSVRMGVELVPSESSITAKERFAGRQQATSGGGSPSQPEASAGAYTVRIKSRGFETERMTTTMTTHGAGLSAPQAVPASPLALIAKAKEKVQEEYGEKASVTVST